MNEPLGPQSTEMLRLSAAVGRGNATAEEREQLAVLLKAHPEWEHDSKIVVRQAEVEEEEQHFDVCLRALLGRPSNRELAELVRSFKTDKKRWKIYSELRRVFEHLTAAEAKFRSMSSPPEIPPESLDRIWDGFRQRKTR